MIRFFANAILACLLVAACGKAENKAVQEQASVEARAALEEAVICHKLARWAARAGPVADRAAGTPHMPDIARQWAQIARDQARLAGASPRELDGALSGELEKPKSEAELNARIDDAWGCAAALEPGRQQSGAVS